MEPVTKKALIRFFGSLGEKLEYSVSINLLGGSALFLLGSPRETLDVDCLSRPLSNDLERIISEFAEKHKLDVEIVPLDEFIPLPSGTENRHILFGEFGQLRVFIFDLYSIALSKIARGFDADLEDVQFLLKNGLIEFNELEHLFDEILPESASADIDSREFQAFFEEIRLRSNN